MTTTKAKEQFEGWTNHATWNLNLWLTNDYGTSQYWGETAQDIFAVAQADSFFTRKEQAGFELAEQLKESHQQFVDEQQQCLKSNGYATSFVNDAIESYLDDVNWYEIAMSFLEECEDVV